MQKKNNEYDKTSTNVNIAFKIKKKAKEDGIYFPSHIQQALITAFQQ